MLIFFFKDVELRNHALNSVAIEHFIKRRKYINIAKTCFLRRLAASFILMPALTVTDSITELSCSFQIFIELFLLEPLGLSIKPFLTFWILKVFGILKRKFHQTCEFQTENSEIISIGGVIQ